MSASRRAHSLNQSIDIIEGLVSEADMVGTKRKNMQGRSPFREASTLQFAILAWGVVTPVKMLVESYELKIITISSLSTARCVLHLQGRQIGKGTTRTAGQLG